MKTIISLKYKLSNRIAKVNYTMRFGFMLIKVKNVK